MITRPDVEAAAARIAPYIRRTPVVQITPGQLWKLEFLQHSGSFKTRGATNRLLAADLPPAGVIAASGGNHGLAVAHAAARLGVPAEVFVPETTPASKLSALAGYGVTVVRHGAEYAEAYTAALARSTVSGALFCHAYDQPDVVAGQGTVGLELPEVDTVIVAVGGGGLMSGIAAAVEGRARVVGVEPVGIPTLHEALAAGGPVDVPVSGVAADSLGARRLGSIAYDVAVRTGVRGVLVSDDDIVAARRWIWDTARLVVEHAAAAAVAALRTGAYVPAPGERVAVILCGANTDPSSA
ncbi:MAG TPA: threonine/serine dehydratase [Mycobacteriales bacterium]|nr:threonine/serine dehydratase [Mycobacteriales bacterium]